MQWQGTQGPPRASILIVRSGHWVPCHRAPVNPTLGRGPGWRLDAMTS